MFVANAPRAARGAGTALLLSVLTCILWGCSASYTTPGRAADFKALGVTRDQLSDASIVQTLSKQPLAQFPCAIAAVRIQAPGYSSETAESYGTGKYSVVTTRDIEGDEFQRLAKMPMVSGIVPLNRLILPATLTSDMELRQAAASLHADMLLIYTLDTTYHLNDEAQALTVLTLGVSPNQVVHIVSTASAVLLDTRNGYLYGYAEATERIDQLANSWGAEATIDDARRRAESKSFNKLAGQVEQSWSGIVRKFSASEESPKAATGAQTARLASESEFKGRVQ